MATSTAKVPRTPKVPRAMGTPLICEIVQYMISHICDITSAPDHLRSGALCGPGAILGGRFVAGRGTACAAPAPKRPPAPKAHQVRPSAGSVIVDGVSSCVHAPNRNPPVERGMPPT